MQITSLCFLYNIGASIVSLKVARFSVTPAIRVTLSVWKTVTVATPALCAAMCLETDVCQCVGYNLITSDNQNQLLCELVNDVNSTIADSQSNFAIAQVFYFLFKIKFFVNLSHNNILSTLILDLHI